MIHNLEINIRVNVNNVSQKKYEKIIEMLQEHINSKFGIEDWELNSIIDPHKYEGKKPYKTYFPVSIQFPEMNRDEILPQTTKIEIIG